MTTLLTLALLLAQVRAPALPVAEDGRAVECDSRARLVYIAARGRAAGLSRERFHWTTELDEGADDAATRREVDAVWDAPEPVDPMALAQAAYGRCIGQET